VAKPAILLASLLVLVCSPLRAGGGESGDTRSDMNELFGLVTTVFRLSLDADSFEDPVNRGRILDALYGLAEASRTLGAHGEKPEPSYDYFGRALARDANEAVLRFRQDRYEGARFVVGKLTNNCFDCHSRLPSDRVFRPGGPFLEELDTGSLDPRDLARLQVVTRQFGPAMDTCEEILLSSATPAAKIAVSGVFEEYFAVGLRVQCDFDRVLECLERFAKRPDVPPYLGGRINRWYTDLKQIRKTERKPRGDLLERGRTLVRDAQYQSEFPNDPRSIVRFVVASGCLLRYLQQDSGADSRRLAEAYYLLGVAESNISRSYWSSETEMLLEKSIRLAPGSVFARMAYNFLEEYTVRGYTGSSGVHVPPDVQELLDELRALVETEGP
jgi:hypothetical protein